MAETARTGYAPAIEHVVLVNASDVAIGFMEKLEAHRIGAMHRAFSVTVINGAGEMLMQRRALTKYHSGGLWSNACCGHPRPGESVPLAARRRLYEELGIRCEIRHVGEFAYRARVTPELEEHEYDHVLVGTHDADPDPDPAEVMEWRWCHPSEELERMNAFPAHYTAWLPFVLPRSIAAMDRRHDALPAQAAVVGGGPGGGLIATRTV